MHLNKRYKIVLFYILLTTIPNLMARRCAPAYQSHANVSVKKVPAFNLPKFRDQQVCKTVAQPELSARQVSKGTLFGMHHRAFTPEPERRQVWDSLSKSIELDFCDLAHKRGFDSEIPLLLKFFKEGGYLRKLDEELNSRDEGRVLKKGSSSDADMNSLRQLGFALDEWLNAVFNEISKKIAKSKRTR